MQEQNTRTVHDMEAEGAEVSASSDIIDLCDVSETKGGPGSEGDGHGGFFNPM